MHMQQKRPKTRMCHITDTLYNEAAFSPDAPEFPPLAPVKPRATPYTIAPRVCTVNYRTGTVKCWDNQSAGELHPGLNTYPLEPPPPRPAFMSPLSPRRIPPTFNYVQTGFAVDEPPDSPLNRILQRPPTGPWQLVGAAIAHGDETPPKEKTMMVYAQTVDSARDRYNYRVVDNNSVPLDVGYKVHWKNNGDPLHVPGYHHKYKLHLYDTYRA